MENGGEELGIVGLGKIGGGLAAHALERGMRVVGNTEGRVGGFLDER
jgi:phosphoglycerate dehydrogenase-like enzyme